MKQARINPDLTVTFDSDAAVPTPKEFEVVVKTETASINPSDWKAALRRTTADQTPGGADFAGTVHAVGSKVLHFKPGDRVGALFPRAAFAEYSTAPSFSTFKLPDHVSFEDAVAYGLTYYTAAVGLFKHMPAPAPWSPARTGDSNPLLVYGASSAVGAYVVKLAALANIHPIIAVAGAAANDTIASILSPEYGDTLIDYRKYDAPEALVATIKAATAREQGVKYAYDVVTTEYSINRVIAHVIDPQGSSHVAYAATANFAIQLPPQTAVSFVSVPNLFVPHDPEGEKGPNGPNNEASRAHASVASRYLEFALGEGLIKPHPFRVLPNGLNGLEEGLHDLKNGRNKSLKYVMRIGDTDWSG